MRAFEIVVAGVQGVRIGIVLRDGDEYEGLVWLWGSFVLSLSFSPFVLVEVLDELVHVDVGDRGRTVHVGVHECDYADNRAHGVRAGSSVDQGFDQSLFAILQHCLCKQQKGWPAKK